MGILLLMKAILPQVIRLYNLRNFNCIGGETMDYYKIGQRIRKYRKACNFSQEQLAEKVGISVTHMSHIETGNTKMGTVVLVRIAKELSVQIDALIYDVPELNKTTVHKELASVLDSCSTTEATFLIEILKTAKLAMNKYLK